MTSRPTCCKYNQSVSSRHFCVLLFWFQLNVRKKSYWAQIIPTEKKNQSIPKGQQLDESSSFKLTLHYLGQVEVMQKTHHLTNSKSTIATPYSITFLLFIFHHYRSLTSYHYRVIGRLSHEFEGGGVELNTKCCTELTFLLKKNFLSFCSHNEYVLPILSQIASLSVGDPFKPVVLKNPVQVPLRPLTFYQNI